MKIINPETLPSPRGYNNGALYSGGRILFIAGQIGWDNNGRIAADFVSQFDQAIRNILEVVRSAGGNPEDIGRLTIYVKDKQMYLKNLKQIGIVYRNHLKKHFPAMSLLVVKDLLEEAAEIEIEATAVIS